jgi:hypothetical protein
MENPGGLAERTRDAKALSWASKLPCAYTNDEPQAARFLWAQAIHANATICIKSVSVSKINICIRFSD